MKHLLDTNVISELAARRPHAQVVRWIDSLAPESVYLSAITVGELRKGIEKLPASPRKEKLQAWLTDELLVRFQGQILVLDVDAMLVWGELTGRLERRGRRLSALDSLIAALAMCHSCTLVTRNEADFQDLGLTVVNPWK